MVGVAEAAAGVFRFLLDGVFGDFAGGVVATPSSASFVLASVALGRDRVLMVPVY